MAEMYVDHSVVERRFDASLVAQLQLQDAVAAAAVMIRAVLAPGQRLAGGRRLPPAQRFA